MVKTKTANYVELISAIGQCVDEVEFRQKTFDRAQSIVKKMDGVNLEELCHCQGIVTYRHNKYLLDVFYLFLGECYDFALDEEVSDATLAKKYYALSNQPPAKWRLAKMYLEKKLRYDGDTNIVAGKLISEAINELLVDMENDTYFDKRFNYLLDMYQDLDKTGETTIYYEILRWVLKHKQYLRSEHDQLLLQLCEYEVPSQSDNNQKILDQIWKLIESGGT